jgi:hypothetical protein
VGLVAGLVLGIALIIAAGVLYVRDRYYSA